MSTLEREQLLKDARALHRKALKKMQDADDLRFQRDTKIKLLLQGAHKKKGIADFIGVSQELIRQISHQP